MFCKFCGETIDRRTMRCSSCGKSAGPLAGGVGFWDLAGQPAPAAPVVNPGEMGEPHGRNAEVRTDYQNNKQPAPKKVPILALVAVVLSLILLVMNIMLWGDIRVLEQKYEELASRPNWVGEMLENIEPPANNDATEAALPDTTAVPAEEPGTIAAPAETTTPPAEAKPEWIREQPEDRVLSAEEIESGKPMKLFELKVDGKDLEFRWEKYDTEADIWIEVDEKRYEEEDEDRIGSDLAVLILEKWSEDVYGEYRCVIFDEAGNREVSETVYLTPAEEK